MVEGLDRQAGARRIQSGAFKSPCGDANSAAKKVGICVLPILELVENKVPDPKGDADLLAVCDRFANSEKCVRSFAKDCLSGIHKTAVGAVASATKRYRVQECKTAESRGKYTSSFICSNRMGKEMIEVNNNVTGIAQAIRELSISPEEKMVKICCLLDYLDREIIKRFDRDCPKETPLILGIVHALTDDARATLCRNPKCNGVLTNLGSTKYRPPQNMMEVIMQILFEISTE